MGGHPIIFVEKSFTKLIFFSMEKFLTPRNILQRSFLIIKDIYAIRFRTFKKEDA